MTLLLLCTTYQCGSNWDQVPIKQNHRANKQAIHSSKQVYGKANERCCILYVTYSVFQSSNVLLLDRLLCSCVFLGEVCFNSGMFQRYKRNSKQAARRHKQIISLHWNKISKIIHYSNCLDLKNTNDPQSMESLTWFSHRKSRNVC